MIFNKTGRVTDDFYVLGHPWTPVYLLNGQQPVLFEAGLACLSRIYDEAIRAVLGRRRPKALFISHVHFDHYGAMSYLKKVFPGLQVAASSMAALIIKRPNAQKLTRILVKDLFARSIDSAERFRARVDDLLRAERRSIEGVVA
jgi:glyoxylase-like metal-dependent hydrolase (beta-lactamase superfamily II)